MNTATYQHRRGEIEHYFDRTAAQTWARLTSDAPVGRIRATVRAGRDRMRATLLSWLPEDLNGRRILDAGCGTGALAIEAARRGAEVVAIDLSPTLVALAQERLPESLGTGSVHFCSGDMLDPQLGELRPRGGDGFADPLPRARRGRRAVAAGRAHAPFNRLHRRAAHAGHDDDAGMGKLFPRSDRSPAIEPIAPAALRRLMAADASLAAWHTGRYENIAAGFYKSQALEWIKA